LEDIKLFSPHTPGPELQREASLGGNMNCKILFSWY